MKSLFLVVLVGLGLAFPFGVKAGVLSATIALSEPVSGDVTYDVTIQNVRNPYTTWVGQRCYLAGELVDTQYQGVQWTTVSESKGNKFDAVGIAGPFQTSGIHHGSGGVDTPWTSDYCEAWVWLYPDLDPIASTPLFPV